jgi:hypothetical protein
MRSSSKPGKGACAAPQAIQRVSKPSASGACRARGPTAGACSGLGAAALIIPLATSACGGTPKDRLQGRWLGESIENMSSEHVQRATGWVKGAAIEFIGNKVTVTIPAETPRTGTFKVTRSDGERMVVSFFREEGGRDEAEMQFIGPNSLKWKIGAGREIVLLKSKH